MTKTDVYGEGMAAIWSIYVEAYKKDKAAFIQAIVKFRSVSMALVSLYYHLVYDGLLPRIENIDPKKKRLLYDIVKGKVEKYYNVNNPEQRVQIEKEICSSIHAIKFAAKNL